MPWLEHGIVTVSLVALLLGSVGGSIAWRNWRRTREIASKQEQGSTDRHASRDAFIALASALFLFALIATDLAWLIVSPCGGR